MFGCHRARLSAVAGRWRGGERGQQIVLGAEHVKPRVLQADHVGFDLGPVLHGFGDQILQRDDRVLSRHVDVVGGNDVRAHHGRVIEAAARQHALQDQFLLQYLRLLRDHILLRGFISASA